MSSDGYLIPCLIIAALGALSCKLILDKNGKVDSLPCADLINYDDKMQSVRVFKII